MSQSKLLFVISVYSSGYFLIDKEDIGYKLLHILDENTVSEITLVEGAAASAIWGSRGSNGVVIITTKKNRKTKKKIKAIYKKQTQKKH